MFPIWQLILLGFRWHSLLLFCWECRCAENDFAISSGLQFVFLVGLTITYTYFQIPLGSCFVSQHEGSEKEWLSPHNCWALHQRMLGSRWLCLLRPSIASTFVILFANGMGTYETAYALTSSNVNL